jgi:hypothetical protein
MDLAREVILHNAQDHELVDLARVQDQQPVDLVFTRSTAALTLTSH